MSADAIGISGLIPSFRISVTSATPAAAPVRPPLAPARINALYVWEVGASPEERISRYKSNASLQLPSAPTA